MRDWLSNLFLLAIGAGVLVAVIVFRNRGSEQAPAGLPPGTITGLDAETIAKIAYVQADPAASLASCKATGHDSVMKTWSIQCSLGTPGSTVETIWQVDEQTRTAREISPTPAAAAHGVTAPPASQSQAGAPPTPG